MKVSDLYQKVTDRIIDELEQGTPPWTQPWKATRIKGVGLMPSNLITGRLYSGSNVLLLWMEATARGWPYLQFCTFKQAMEIGANVRKGETATPIIFTKHVADENDDGERVSRTVARCFYVFNVAQLENVPEKYQVAQTVECRPVANIQAQLYRELCGVPVHHVGNKACYWPSRDSIEMPPIASFTTEDDYWGTLCHEITHASGHPKRLDRQFGKRFGDDRYAFEELVAELGSAFTCAMLGIPPSFRSAAYISHWLGILKQDKSAIFSAASHASKAATFMWDTAFPPQAAEKAA
jgi:antirestriction protein ArdC